MFDAVRTPTGAALFESDGGSDNGSTPTTEQPNIDEELRVGAEVHNEALGGLSVDKDGYQHVQNVVES